MSEHVIYKSEFAVRSENEQLKAELARVRADNTRLRAIVGEQPMVMAPAIARATADEQVHAESFTVGNCKVQIGPLPGSAPVMNPMVAAARAKKLAKAGQPLDLPASTQPVEIQPAQQMQAVGGANAQNGVDNDDGATRFSLIELR